MLSQEQQRIADMVRRYSSQILVHVRQQQATRESWEEEYQP